MNAEDKKQIRSIVREEAERALRICLDAKTTATALTKGAYYSDGSEHAPSPSHNKSALPKKSS
jgi:hypothetical protein